MKAKYILILTSLLCLYEISFSQHSNNLSYTISFGEAYVIPTNDFIKGVNVDSTKVTNQWSINLKVDKTLNGEKSWHHLYNDLRYGLGLYYGHFNYSKNVNNPFALYAYMGFSPLKYKRFELKNDVALGISGVWDVYSKKNYYNEVVSDKFEAYIHWHMDAYYNLSSSSQISLGIGATHFSNGATKKPNRGFNIVGAQIGYTYKPHTIKLIEPLDTLSYDKRSHLLFNLYYARHAVFVDYRIQASYAVAGFQTRFMKHLSYKYNLGVGADICFNNAVGKNVLAYYEENLPQMSTWERTSISSFLAFAYNIHDLSVILEPSIYLHKAQKAYFSRFYQRIGLKYTLMNHYILQMALRAYNFTKADFIELGVGYQI